MCRCSCCGFGYVVIVPVVLIVVVTSKLEVAKLRSKKYLFKPDETETLKFFIRAISDETKLCLSDHTGLPARAQWRQNKRTSTFSASSTMESVGAEGMLIIMYTVGLGDVKWSKKMSVLSRLVMKSATIPDYALEAHGLCMSTKSNINVSKF